MKNYEEAIRRLRDAGIEIFSTVSATSADIAAIEARLGVSLPLSYRAMLSQFGIMSFEGIEVYGWTPSGVDGKSIPNVVFATEEDRKKGLISDQMVDFMVAGYGPTFVLDCAETGTDGEAPVYEIPAGGIKHGKDRLADSFGAFLLKEVERVVQDLRNEQAAASAGEDVGNETSRKWMADYWKQRAKDFE